MKKKGILAIKGGFIGGLKGKAHKLPKTGMAQIGRDLYKSKKWKPNVRP